MQQLVYAASRRRGWWRALIGLLAIVVAWVFLPRLKSLPSAIELKRAEWECNQFSSAREQVAVDFEADCAVVTAGSSDYVTVQARYFDSYARSVLKRPLRLLIPKALRRYQPAVGSLATVFLNERTSPNGNKRLVVVAVEPLGGASPDSPSVAIEAYSLPSLPFWSVQPRQHDYSATKTWIHPWVDGQGQAIPVPPRRIEKKNRFVVGIPDPKDPSRFAIPYTLWGVEDVIDGQLLNDGGVRLKPRIAYLLFDDMPYLPPD